MALSFNYVPDAPINLANDPTTTTDTVIKFTWNQGVSNGGTSVIDYSVYYDQGSGIIRFAEFSCYFNLLCYISNIDSWHNIRI